MFPWGFVSKGVFPWMGFRGCGFHRFVPVDLFPWVCFRGFVSVAVPWNLFPWADLTDRIVVGKMEVIQNDPTPLKGPQMTSK